MRSTDHPAPFDHEIDAQSDVTQEFWGRSADWQRHGDSPSRRLPRVDDTGSLRAIRDGVAAFRPQRVELRDPSGEIHRTRSHGAQRPVRPTASEQRAAASIGDLAAGHFDDLPDDPAAPRTGDIELTSRSPVAERLGLGGVDPLLARLGAIVLVGVLLVPLALAMRPSSDEPDTVPLDPPAESVQDAAGAAPVVAATDSDEIATSDPDQTNANPDATSAGSRSADSSAPTAAAPRQSTSTADSPGAESTSEEAVSSGAAAPSDGLGSDSGESASTGIVEPAVAEAPAERIVPECPQTYDASTGDSWYRIAEAAGVTPAALLAENRATVDSVILPGDEICLPAGATMPAPPPAPAADEPEPATETTEAPATTQAPTTTTAPTTPSGSPGADASVEEVKDLIRASFPESEWETAFVIVQRESRFDPTAYNGWCCYGLFQIYWSVHSGWLDDYGIDSSDDLLDPLLNVKAAKVLWERAGNSWSPWSTYDG